MRLEKYKEIHSDLIQKKMEQLEVLQEKGEEHVTVRIDETLAMLKPLEELRKEVIQVVEELEGGLETCLNCLHYPVCMIREDFKMLLAKYQPTILTDKAYSEGFEVLGDNCNKYSLST